LIHWKRKIKEKKKKKRENKKKKKERDRAYLQVARLSVKEKY